MPRAIFNLIALTSAIARVKAPKTFLYDLCIGKEQKEKTQKFELHTKDAGRLRAPLVGRRERGVLIEKGSFISQFVEPAFIKLHTINYAEEMFEQKFSKTQYADPNSSAKEELADSLKTLKEISFRTRNWMLGELLMTGICPMATETAGVKYDPGFAKDILSGSDLWSDPNADIVGYLEEKQEEIQKKTGLLIDTLVVHPDVAGALKKNNTIKDNQAFVHINLFQLDDGVKTASRGEKKVAMIPHLNMTIYSYMDWSKELGDNGEELPVIPSGHVIGLQRGSFRVHYGALLLRAKAGESARLYVEKEVVRNWYPDGSEDDELQLFSAPLIVPNDAQGYFCAEVL